jgi:hypothetical protein
MTTKQAILLALNGQMKRAELLSVLGIVGTEGNYRYKRKESEKKGFAAPEYKDVVEFFRSRGYSETGAKMAYDYYVLGGWCDSKGKPVINWKQKMSANWMREEYKIKSKTYKTLNID